MRPFCKTKSTWFILVLSLVACADSEPGTVPPNNQLFYPIHLLVAPGASASEDRLLVSNSNFDQRFNASTIMALSLDSLFATAAKLTPESPVVDLPVESSQRIPSLSGEISWTGLSTSAESSSVFVTSRQGNFLTMLRFQQGNLSCDNGTVETFEATDCTKAHITDTGGSDPYALQFVPQTNSSGLIATGHLRITSRPREEIRPDIGIVTFADIDLFKQRLIDERDSKPLQTPIRDITVPALSGVSGIALVSPNSNDTDQNLLVADLNQTTGAFSEWNIDGVVSSTSTAIVSSTNQVSLGSLANSFATRGLVVSDDGTRAYVSLRFSNTSNDFNSGIAILRKEEGGDFALVSVYEFGSEVGLPTLRNTVNGRRLLYAGDVKTNSIWVVDVTADAPRVVAELRGQITLDESSDVSRLNLLSGPSHIAFATRGQRTLGFVSNFSNSTLAVIDVTDPDVSQHRVVGRLGRVLEPDGTDEEDNEL